MAAKKQNKKPPRQRILIWTGGASKPSEEETRLAMALPVLPVPTQLRRGALIEYFWGTQHFQIIASAGTLRSTAWGDKQVTWLHCKAIPTAEIKLSEPTGVIAALIPTHYIVTFRPDRTFRLAGSKPCGDLGLFTPIWPAPANALPLEIIERVLEDLLAPERN